MFLLFICSNNQNTYSQQKDIFWYWLKTDDINMWKVNGSKWTNSLRGKYYHFRMNTWVNHLLMKQTLWKSKVTWKRLSLQNINISPPLDSLRNRVWRWLVLSQTVSFFTLSFHLTFRIFPRLDLLHDCVGFLVFESNQSWCTLCIYTMEVL